MVWSAQDSLVLKAITLLLSDELRPKLSPRCFHLAGQGGAKGCVNAVSKTVDDDRYVCRSDVNSYYAMIDHGILMKQLQALIPCDIVLNLLSRMLDRLDDVQGVLHSVDIGISKGHPISPLLGAVYLQSLDEQLSQYREAHDLFYGRFMDNQMILYRTCHQLWMAVRLMNWVLDSVKMLKPFKIKERVIA